MAQESLIVLRIVKQQTALHQTENPNQRYKSQFGMVVPLCPSYREALRSYRSHLEPVRSVYFDPRKPSGG